MEARQYLDATFEESLRVKKSFIEENRDRLLKGAEWMASTIQSGGKILIMGNGGSAADAQHMAAEMVGRMLIERRPLPALALTTDTSNLTAVSNDYSYEDVFLKQVEGLARKGDLVIAISTSGNSMNVVKAARKAQQMGCRVLGLTGGSGGELISFCDLCINASDGTNSSRIQETHIFAYHSLVDLCDRFFLKEWLRSEKSSDSESCFS